MDDLLVDLKKMMANSPKPQSPCTPMVNVVCSGVAGTLPQTARSCLPIELIKNGSFEEIGQFTTFRDWEEDLDPGINLEREDLIAYEGTFGSEFSSLTTTDVESKMGLIRQSVPVTPGCFLILSFADNFETAGEEFDDLDIGAKVFYTDTAGNHINLINIEIDYSADQASNGYVFHQKVSGSPVPLNVSSATVEFVVQIEDTSGTVWLLDGVSLRSL